MARDAFTFTEAKTRCEFYGCVLSRIYEIGQKASYHVRVQGRPNKKLTTDCIEEAVLWSAKNKVI